MSKRLDGLSQSDKVEGRGRIKPVKTTGAAARPKTKPSTKPPRTKTTASGWQIKLFGLQLTLARAPKRRTKPQPKAAVTPKTGAYLKHRIKRAEIADKPSLWQSTAILRRRTLVALSIAAVVITGLAVWLPGPTAVASGDGVMVYGVSGNTNPQFRTYNGTANTFSSAANTTNGATPMNVITRTSPTKLEAIAGYQDASGNLRIYCYDGATWSADLSIAGVAPAATPTTRRFDIAYETNTGDVVVLYSTNTATTNELAYRTKSNANGCGAAGWSGATNLTSARTNGIVHWVKLAWDRRAASNLITAIWADAASDLSASVWSGSGWGNEHTAALETSLEVVAAAQDVDNFDVEYESTSGDVLVVWGNSAGSNAVNGARAAVCTGGTSTCTWTTGVAFPAAFQDDVTNLDISANPNTNEIVLGAIGNAGSDLTIGYWNGSAWTGTTAGGIDQTAGTPLAGTHLVSTAWLISGAQTRSIVVYNDAATTNVGYYAGNAGTFGAQADFGPTPAFANPQKWYELQTNPLSPDRLMFNLSDNGADLFAKRLVMSTTAVFTWTNADGGVAQTTTLGQATVGDFSFAYWRIIPNPSLSQSSYRWFAGNDSNDLSSRVANPSGGTDEARGSAMDTTNQVMYTVGSDSVPGNTQWRIQKRSLADGTLVNGFGTGGVVQTNPSANADAALAVVYDATSASIYIVGYDGVVSATDESWRIEKRSSHTGDLDTGFGVGGVVRTNPTVGTNSERATTIVTDGTNIYIGGFDNTGGNNRWRVEKRLMTTGGVVSGFGAAGISATNPTAGVDQINDLVIDVAGGNLYLIGFDSTGANRWRIEKRLLTTAAVVAAFGATGILTINPSVNADVALSGVIDGSGNLYLAGYDGVVSATDRQIRVEKRLQSTGAVVAAFGATGVITNNDSPGEDVVSNLYLDETNGFLYSTGWSTPSGADTQWRASKRDTTAGALVTAFGDGGEIYSNPTTQVDNAYTAALDPANDALYLAGEQGGADSAWRIEKRDATSGLGLWATGLAAVDTAASAPAQGVPFRLQLLLHAAANDLAASGGNFKLQMAVRSGTCAATPSGNFADVSPSSGAIRLYNNTNPTDNDSTNALDSSLAPTHGGHTVAAQVYDESGAFTNTSQVGITRDGMWDISLVDFSATAGTTYCFRTVNSDNSPLDGGYTVYPEITTVGANIVPDDPTSLEQRQVDDTVLAVGAWHNATAIKFAALAEDPDPTETLYLCVEKKPISTAFTNVEDACGTGVAYSGTPVTTTVTIQNPFIADQTEYHWQARLKDSSNNYSSWEVFGGNSDVITAARDFGIDTTGPTGGTVFDGTSVGIDGSFNDGSLSALSANWTAPTTTISGLARYDYSIGTTAGATDVRDWTNNNTTTSVTATGLTLRTSQMYYVNVRTVDNAGNESVISSNGQQIAPTLSFSVSPATLTFNNLNAGNGFTNTQNTTLTTSTNAYGGYVVRASESNILRTLDTLFSIPDFSAGSYATPAPWSGVGFGYTSDDDSIQSSGDKFCSGTCYAPFSQSRPGDIVADNIGPITGSPISGQVFTITTRVTTTSVQAARTYNTVLTYTATPVY